VGEGGRKENDGGSEFSYNILFVSTFVNVTMYSQYNNVLKKFFLVFLCFDPKGSNYRDVDHHILVLSFLEFP
jgi:hypothetical protein